MLFNFLAKYTYTNGDCLEYGGPLQDSKDFDTLEFTATQCLLDPKCRAFKYIFGASYNYLCHTFIPRPNGSNWEPYQGVSTTFLLDSGMQKLNQCK